MKVFRLEALRARHGDALLLHVGDSRKQELILIDGGPSEVCEGVLLPRLRQLRPGRTAPLHIRLLVVSHIDEDHVQGLIDLTTAMGKTGGGEASWVRIREMWHNSFSDDLLKGEKADRVRTSSLQLASVVGDDPKLAEALAPPTALVLDSVGQGRELRSAAGSLGIPINRAFEDELVLRETAPDPAPEIGGVKLRVLGPGRAEVMKLEERWRKDLPKVLEREAKRRQKLEAASRLDSSVFNLSSLVLIADSPDGVMLLTGDARGDRILDWLEAADFMEKGGTAHFSLLKLPHHGSDRNVTPAFFERVTADHYVISGDGRHGNPEPRTFDMLFAARGTEAEYTVHMTYGPEELARHKDFRSRGEDGKSRYERLEEVLDEYPCSRDKLSYPFGDEPSIVVDL